MTTSMRKSDVKNIFIYLITALTFLTLTACGGGGGGGGTPPPAAKTTATLTITLSDTLPSLPAITGADFTLTLPANVTPANTNGTVTAGVATNSGTFAGSTILPYVDYTAANGNVPGKLRIILSSSEVTGVSLTGEVAKITLQLANGAVPTTGSFGMSPASIIDVPGNTISGIDANVASVTLQ